MFRQVWPLIKHKVKDPDGLLKGIVGSQITEDVADSAEIENLKAQVAELGKSQQRLQDEVQVEREARQSIEMLFQAQQGKIGEMQAFQQTVQAYTRTKSPVTVRNKTASTAESTQEQVIPSFLKALYITEEC